MKYGFIIPGGAINTILKLASDAEKRGWDGVFYWDGIYIEQVPLMYDAWTILAAMALVTKKVRIGALLTAVTRRRPWKLAREAMTVDQLSNGRLIMPVGLGAMDDGGYTKVGEPLDRKVRAELLDDSLEILTGLWSGKPFSYQGKHYKLQRMTFRPTPIQKPRIPIWIVGAWPRMKSITRVLKYDGLIPAKISSRGSFEDVTTSDIREIREFIAN